MAVKKRVFQVAREFNISNEALIDYLKKLNYDIRNHMSPLTEDAYAHVSDKFGEKSLEPEGGEHGFRKKLRDKKAQEKEKKKHLQEELEQKVKLAEELAKDLPKWKKQREAAKIAEEALKEEREKVKVQARLTAEAEEAVVEKPKRHKKKLRIIEIPSEEGARKIREKPAEKPKAEESGKAAPPSEAKEKEGAGKKKKRRRRRKTKTGEEERVEAATTEGVHKRKRFKRKKKKRPEIDEAEIQKTIRETLQAIDDKGKPKKHKKRIQDDEEFIAEEAPVIRVSEFMSLSELANLMDVESSELIKKCMDLGMMVSINQRLDMDTITLLASEYEYEIEALEEFGEDLLESSDESEDDEDNLHPRPPVVTIMGHVDHGKTSLLDYIRKSNIISGEAGGITQHIGAYEVKFDDRNITFLDTPGHEAFTAMRARGAQVTDIVVLIVAADDNVMPQTIEAISHAKAAGVPIIVAINKIDKPNANPDLIRKQMAEQDILVEQWGGKYQSVEISAKTGQAVDQLLEMILLESDVLNLRANPDRKARGVIVESRLDKGKGVVASVLVQNGMLHIGDPFVAGSYSGKVRNMMDERGKRQKEAGPSVPVQVTGFNGLPQAGDSLVVLDSERDTREISQKRQILQREHEHWRNRPRTLDEISRQIKRGQIKNLSVLLKADVDGSMEAISDSLLNLGTDEVGVSIIHKGVGAISESDVLLASASGAIIIGFNVRPTTNARALAAKEEVDIRSYNVIYDIVEDIKSALEGFLEPTLSEENVATIEIRETFKVPKTGVIAGCHVVSGTVSRNDKIKLYREDRLIHDGKIASLKRFKDDVKEVAAGFECGISLERYDDIKINDVIEAYKIIETKRTLE